MHINAISSGQGAPSTFMIVMAGEGMFPCDVVISANTGWERDCLWSTGERTTAEEYFYRVTQPLAEKHGIDAVFVRSLREDGTPYDDLDIAQLRAPSRGGKKEELIDIPLFGSRGGRLHQTCTSKWKIQAVRQELRRRGATTALTALGLHRGEVHRVKPSQVQWDISCWPLVDMMQTRDGGTSGMGIGRTWDRLSIETEMQRRNIPWLVTTECDGCPHKDWARWQRTSPETIDQLAVFEARFHGEFFLTSERVPLKEALVLMEAKNTSDPNTLFDVCESGYCFV